MAYIVTRINVGNYDMWKTMFDKDARCKKCREGTQDLAWRREPR